MSVEGVATLTACSMGCKQAMPEPTNSLLGESTRVVRELATHQGMAYCRYGEALQRFGDNKSDWTDLLKTSGDIYFKEVAQTVWSIVRADLNIYAWMLSMAGAKVLHPNTEQHETAAPASPRPKRGRR
jgi:hypothetical protein